jgi:hypothetical protein
VILGPIDRHHVVISFPVPGSPSSTAALVEPPPFGPEAPRKARQELGDRLKFAQWPTIKAAAARLACGQASAHVWGRG